MSNFTSFLGRETQTILKLLNIVEQSENAKCDELKQKS